jgi:hypothetical protein
MQIMDCVEVELHTNNYGGTKLKRNYIWRYAIEKGSMALLLSGSKMIWHSAKCFTRVSSYQC